MALPQPFTTTTGVLASYDAIDVATGKGYMILYGMAAYGESAKEYTLASTPTASLNGYETGVYRETASVWTAVGDVLDIDSNALNQNITIDGEVIIELACGVRVTGNTGGFRGYPVLKKLVVSTETTILTLDSGYAQGGFVGVGSAGGVAIFKGAVSNQVIQQGEKIRITIVGEVYGTAGGGTAYYGQIGLSPNNEDYGGIKPSTGTEFSNLKVYIPIKIDI